MYGWSGMGDSTPILPSLSDPCGFLHGGVFKPECWCLQNPWMCSAGYNDAAKIMAHPELIASPAMPSVPLAPAIDSSGNPVSTSPDLPAQLAAAAMLKTQAANQATVDAYTATLTDVGGDSGSGFPWLWLAGGLGVFGLVALSAGGPRRYGR